MNVRLEKSRQRQRGLTLVEILVALAVGLFLMAGVGRVYLSNKQAYRTTEAVSRVQENGRFSIAKLTEDLRMAGFMGCGAGGLNITSALDTTDAGYSTDLHDFTVGVEGTDGASNAPDTILVKYATNFGLKIVQQMVQTSANIKVTTNDSVIDTGDIVLVCDVSQGDIFQITNTTQSGGTGSGKDTVVHNTGSGVSPGNYNPGACTGGNAHCLSKSYDTDARIFGLSAIQFSIGTGSGYGSPPALFRTENGVSTEIAEGVENMQVVYGVDTSATTDGQVDAYYNATAIETAITGGSTTITWERVASARVTLLVRTNETNLTNTAQTYSYDHDGDGTATTQTAPDNRIRRVYTVTANMRNRAI